MIPAVRRVWLPTGLAAALAGCAAGAAGVAAPLPFHVAVVPVSSSTAEAIADDATLAVSLDDHALSGSLVAALDERGFALATLLRFPEAGDRPAFLGLPQPEQDAHWLRAAQAVNADLLLVPRLEAPAGLRVGWNEDTWLGFLLFLVGGPFSYFVDDHSYVGDVRLSATVYAVTVDQPASEAVDLRPWRVSVVRASVDECRSDYLDRAWFHPGWMLASIVVPPPILAGDDQRTRAVLRQRLGDDLIASFLGQVHAQHDDSQVFDGLPGLELLAGTWRLATVDGQRRLRGRVRVERDLPTLGLDRCVYWLDEGPPVELVAPAAASVGGPDAFSRYLAYDLDIPLDDARPEVVRLELIAAGSDYRRTYHLAVRALPGW